MWKRLFFIIRARRETGNAVRHFLSPVGLFGATVFTFDQASPVFAKLYPVLLTPTIPLALITIFVLLNFICRGRGFMFYKYSGIKFLYEFLILMIRIDSSLR